MSARGQSACLLLVLAGGCAGTSLGDELRAGRAEPEPMIPSTVGPVNDPSRSLLRVRHRVALAGATDGAYIPFERAAVALDADAGRVYVGTSAGQFVAVDARGQVAYRRRLGQPVDAQPVVDADAGRVYVGTSGGALHALAARTGDTVFTAETGFSFVDALLLDGDAVYGVSDSDVVCALSKEDGSVLWSYRRPPAETITVTGHAGILASEGRLIVAFNDGMIAGLDARDGTVYWEFDSTTVLTPGATGVGRMRDVDTTPVRVGDRLFVGSFAGGLLALDADNGSLLARSESWTGLVRVVALPDGDLFLASADRGFARVDAESFEVRWSKPSERGAPSGVLYLPEHDALVLTESRGSLRALDARDGAELGRVESGQGFGAPASYAGGVLGALTNGANVLLIETR